MSEVKLCKTCKHGQPAHPSGLARACRHPSANQTPDVVEGKLPICVQMRSVGQLCGPAGRLHEPFVPDEAVEESMRSMIKRRLRILVGGMRE